MGTADQKLYARKQGITDSSKVLRDSYRYEEQAIDVITQGTSLVPHKFDRLEYTCDANQNITEVDYYKDDGFESFSIAIGADVAGSLAGKFLLLWTGRDLEKYYLWYRVGGVGTDPNITDATGIVVDISEDDVALVVTRATELALEASLDYYYTIVRASTKLYFTAKQGGSTTNPTDVTTGFLIENREQGSSELVTKLKILYDANENITTITRY
jgi:hypothetical protein